MFTFIGLDLFFFYRCPKCYGVPVRPDLSGCRGCFDCDFSGTRAGYDQMQQMTREAMEAWEEMEESGELDREIGEVEF
jgi:ribosomal protein L37AE/L43A